MKITKIKFNYITLYFLLIALLCGFIKNAIYVLIIIFVHELGHIIVCKIYGYEIIEVEFYPFGGITKVNKLLNNSIKKDLIISISGVLMQLILFIFYKDETFIKYNIIILLFNLLPIIPLDGSKILFEVLNLKFNYNKCLIIYNIISVIGILIFLFINIYYGLNNYLILSLFLYKTYINIKYRKVIYQKFLIEKSIYDIKYAKVKTENCKISDFYKDIKYYYNINGKILSDKEYLLKFYLS